MLKPARVLWLLLGLALGIRLYFLFSHQGMWGVDGGAYLLSRNSVLGQEFTVTDFPRPPLAPGWLLVPFTWVLGDDWGLKAFALVASFVIVPSFLLLARELLTPWQTVWALGLVLGDGMLAEMFTAGPLPMFGFAFIFLAMWALWRIKQRGLTWQTGIALSVSFPGITYTNQTATGIALLALSLFVLFLGIRQVVAKAWLPLGIGVLFGLTALPWYLAVFPGSEQLRYPGPTVGLYSFNNAGWFQFVWGVPVAIIAMWRRAPLLRALGSGLLLTSLFSPLISYDETIQNILYRSRYLMMPLLYLCIIWMVGQSRLRLLGRPILVTGMALLVVVQGASYVYQLQTETKLGRMVTPETQEAIIWLRDNGGPGTVVTNSYSLSLYVAALSDHKTAWVQVFSPPPAYQRQHQQVLVLLGWRAGDAQEAAQELGASYVLAETLWPAYGADIGSKVPGLGKAYALVNRYAQLQDENLGYIWQAPGSLEDDASRSNPWLVTEAKARWLKLIWQKGTTRIWQIAF